MVSSTPAGLATEIHRAPSGHFLYLHTFHQWKITPCHLHREREDIFSVFLYNCKHTVCSLGPWKDRGSDDLWSVALSSAWWSAACCGAFSLPLRPALMDQLWVSLTGGGGQNFGGRECQVVYPDPHTDTYTHRARPQLSWTLTGDGVSQLEVSGGAEEGSKSPQHKLQTSLTLLAGNAAGPVIQLIRSHGKRRLHYPRLFSISCFTDDSAKMC